MVARTTGTVSGFTCDFEVWIKPKHTRESKGSNVLGTRSYRSTSSQSRQLNSSTQLRSVLLITFFLCTLPASASPQNDDSTKTSLPQSFPVTPKLHTDDLFIDFTSTAVTDLPTPAMPESQIYNVSFFEEYIFPEYMNYYSVNESDAALVCFHRNATRHLVDFTNGGEDPYCPHKYDHIFCWPPTPPGIVYRECVRYHGIDYIGNVSRVCNANGTWANDGKSDFACVPLSTPVEESVHIYIQHKILLNIGYVISLAALIGAFFIFLFFKSLRCVRNNIHWNLITSFIILYILFYVASWTQHLATANEEFAWLCRTVVCLINNAILTNFFWMFIEGIYLHLLVVRAMTVRRERFWMYMMFGWGCPLLFTIPHAVARLFVPIDDTEESEDMARCWLNTLVIDYIIYGPIIVVIVVNLFILVHVISILVSKLRASNSFETQQYWKSVRATFILLPLLGGAYFLFIYKPTEGTAFGDLYGYLQVTLQSVQGFFVALFYVYMNQEVVNLLKRKYRRWQESHSIRVTRRSSVTCHTTLPVSIRRGSNDSGASRNPYKLYPPGKVPPFIPGEVVPLQCEMDSTPSLGTEIQEWARGEKKIPLSEKNTVNQPLPNGSVNNGTTISNGTRAPLLPLNGNNNDSEGDGGPVGKSEYVEMCQNTNNHNDSTLTSAAASPEVDDNSVFSAEIDQPLKVHGFADEPSAEEPLISPHGKNQRQQSTSSSCPLLEVDCKEKLQDNHAKWSPKLLLKKLNPHVSTQAEDRPSPIPEVIVDSIQFTETPCGTPV